MTSTPAAAPSRNCVSCGRSISWDANVCPYCGHDYRMTMAGVQPQKKESVMPLIGGILILIVGVLYLGAGGLIAAAGGSILWMDLEGSEVAVVCGVVVLLIGVMVLLGGIFAIQRRHFALAILGGIFALPSILGIIGLILVVVSKDEFR